MGVMKRLAGMSPTAARRLMGGGGRRSAAGRLSGSSMEVGLTLKGAARTTKAFDSLDAKTRRSILRKATTAASGVIRKAVKEKTPRKTGLLRRSLGSKVVKYQKGAVFLGVIGQAKGMGKQKGFASAAVRAKKNKRRGGLSGEGVVLPLWLVNTAVDAHAMPGAKRKKRNPEKPYVFWGWGQVNYREHIPNHPGHSGARFIERGARASERPAAAAFRRKFRAETLKAARAV